MSNLLQTCTDIYAVNNNIGVFGCENNKVLKIIKATSDSIDYSIEFKISKYLGTVAPSTNLINVFDIEKIRIINSKNDLTLSNIEIIKDLSLNFVGSSILYTMEDFSKLDYNLLPKYISNRNFEKIFIILLIKLSLFFKKILLKLFLSSFSNSKD